MPLTPSRESALSVRRTTTDDPLARPLLDELAYEYTTRYGSAHDLSRYPAEEFAPPHGAFLLLLDQGLPVAGGAYRRYDEHTAELKRIWTHSAHRRRGLARRVLTVLEREAAARGYSRVYLTTGPRQPEARGLYLASGYRPLFDVSADPETIGPLPFEKFLENPKP
ncbi:MULTISPECIES: GNAT family N-acetyltransferase [unclassified Streptomyces]|uniref:GNAT family N-acetyltransferase n=1 Tax=unclassified Streptomyces TaxID=2593676 RepID=UPI0006AE9F2E|nr:MULTISPECIES: GNAT family N-acetyltransferase [unclassified Streptomyces]KOX38267.1 acetyltransferase [Streptomyces sp. NRRL F-6491]KOX52420.1 acetyltransferase [Streptomyces sp. NRRL F-6492]